MPSMKLISRFSSAWSSAALRSSETLHTNRGVRSIHLSMANQNGSAGGGEKALTIQNLNPNIIKLEYAVRGPLVIRAGEIEKELEKGANKPFKRVIRANIGDAHAMGQQPITFIRQVLASTMDPSLLKSNKYPEDVATKAEEILAACGGKSMGAYTGSQGIDMIRRAVAEYIAKRDNHPSKWQDVFLSGGASICIKVVLQLLCNEVNGKPSGVLIPIPQYPLYSATLAEYGLAQCGYYLDEDSNWGLNLEELEKSYQEHSANASIRAIVVINPGNPTGQVLTRSNIEGILQFAHKHHLMVMADEVYQHNIYAEGSEFHSFKKVLMESPMKNELELASFMSASKGYMGECGIRGGWCELVNFNPDVQAQLYKAMSASLCSTTAGQAVIYCVANPPKEGEPSYELYMSEKTAVLDALKERAQLVTDTFNSMPGFKCNVLQGAMYAFPQISLPNKAIEAAKAEKKPADVFYAWKLLEETGICVVPGSGFNQRPGTYHFRTTILPQTEMLKEMLAEFKEFHEDFTQRYS